MKYFPTESIIFTLSSLLVLFVVQANTPPYILQQTIVALLVLLIILSRFIFSPTQKFNARLVKNSMLFLSCLFVQILVVATGGFYSPFLIILYLFTLGSSFLLNLQSSIIFLVFSVIILIFNTIINPSLSQIFKDDPWSVILYLASFTVTIPLTQLLTKSYHVKDVITKILSEHLHIVESREETILRGLNEVVLVTDINLSILSANEAALIAMNASISEIIGRKFLDVVPLKDKNDEKPTKETLELSRVLTDKTTHIVPGFSFYRKGNNKTEKVTLQIRPIGDLKGGIKQIVFVISNAQPTSEPTEKELSIEQAKIRYLALVESFKKLPILDRFPEIIKQFDLLEKVREDLLAAVEIENKSQKDSLTIEDIAKLSKQAVDLKQDFAKTLNVSLDFVLPSEEIAEIGLLRLAESKINSDVIPASVFSAPINRKWLLLLLQKLIDIGILLATGKNPLVHVLVNREETKVVKVGISIPIADIAKEKVNELFKEYYGELSHVSNLSLGSGLEGILAKRIADRLNVPLTIDVFDNPKVLVFLLKFTKEP